MRGAFGEGWRGGMGCVEKNLLTQGQVPVRAWGSEFLERKKEPLAKANRLAKGLNTGSRVGMGSAGGLWFGGIGVGVFRSVERNILAFLKICHVRQTTYKTPDKNGVRI
jgi:hypothetical protein